RGIAPLPMLKSLLDDLSGLDSAVYSDVSGNPVKSQVDRGVAAYKSHNADGVIGLGGGAALDVAKAVALMATHPGDILEYAWDHPHVRPIDGELPYFVALPTTAGTGSEVGRSAVVSDDTTHVKKIVFSPKLLRPCLVARPGADPPPPRGHPRRHRHGRAHAQCRIVSVAGIPSAMRWHRARRRTHRRPRIADRRA